MKEALNLHQKHLCGQACRRPVDVVGLELVAAGSPDASSGVEEAVATVLSADAEAVADELQISTPMAAAALAIARALAATVASNAAAARARISLARRSEEGVAFQLILHARVQRVANDGRGGNPMRMYMPGRLAGGPSSIRGKPSVSSNACTGSSSG